MLPTQGYATGYGLTTQGYGSALLYLPGVITRAFATLEMNTLKGILLTNDLYMEVTGEEVKVL